MGDHVRPEWVITMDRNTHRIEERESPRVFRRPKLRKHKDPGGWDCPGRQGVFMDMK